MQGGGGSGAAAALSGRGLQAGGRRCRCMTALTARRRHGCKTCKRRRALECESSVLLGPSWLARKTGALFQQWSDRPR